MTLGRTFETGLGCGSVGTLESFFSGLGRRGKPELASAVREAAPLTDDPAILAVHSLTARQTAQRLSLVNGQARQVEREIDACFGRHPDAPIFSSFPGAGCLPVILCTM